MHRALRHETGGTAPALDLVVTEPETPVGVLKAQEFKIRGGEIDDYKPPTLAQHAGRLGDGGGGVVGIMKHLVDGDGIEGGAWHRQFVHVAMADPAIAPSRPFQIGAGKRQHLAREVDAEPALHLVAE